jgi:hypothetical protein
VAATLRGCTVTEGFGSARTGWSDSTLTALEEHMRFLVVASLVLAGCHPMPMPPCHVFVQAMVPDHPLHTRLLLVSDVGSAYGPVFSSAEDALVFAKDANLLLCATEPKPEPEPTGESGIWCAGHFVRCPCGADAGQPDAGTDAGAPTIVSVAILADGGARYTKELR